MRSFPNNNLFGTRNPETGKYEYKTYNQALEIAKEIGSGIEALKLAYRANREWRNYDLNLVGVMGKNREEWILLDYSNILYKNVMVPLYDTLGP
jgi:long-chain acyl-CoA synthetase